MRSISLALAAVLLATPCAAIMDSVVDWQALEVQAVVDGEPVVVTARVERGRITYLSLRVRGRSSAVPVAELAGVPSVLLRTVRVVSPDVKSHKGPNVRIEVELVPVQATEQRGVAEFHFVGGRYLGRLVERVVDGKLVIRESKEVGHPPRPAQR